MADSVRGPGALNRKTRNGPITRRIRFVSIDMGHLGKCRDIAILIGLILCGKTQCPAATPVPVLQSVTDSAAYGPRVAPGSLATIFGTNLASGDPVSASGFPLPTSLGGSSVTIGGESVPLLYVSPSQINFQVPTSVQSGSVGMVVHGPGGASTSFNFTVTSSAPAMFQYGTNHALAQNSDGVTLNSASDPAVAGSVITVYLTGIGAVDNAVPTGTATPPSPLSTATATPTATIGPKNAPVQFLGLTSGFAGFAQANIQVPTLPAGDYPLVLTVGGYVSASAVISVSGSGSPYTSPLQLSGSVAFANSTNSTLVLYNNVAYVCGANRIVMVDVTNATQPSLIGEFGDGILNGNGQRCAINTTVGTPYLVEIFGVATNPESFVVYGLSNARSPNLLVTATTSYPQMVSLSFVGNYGFATTSYITYYTNGHAIAAQSGDLLVFDFTNPAGPLFLGMLQPSAQPGSGDLNLKPFTEIIDQIYAFIASSTATGTSTGGIGVLNVINVASPSNPYAIAQVGVNQAAILLRLDISGNTLLAAGNTSGQRNPGNPDFDFLGNLTLTTMDVSNPQLPSVIATSVFTMQVNGTLSVEGFTNGVFAIVNSPPATDDFGPSTLAIVDARKPSSILLYPFQAQFGFNSLLTTINNYLLAPTSLGLNIYQLQLL